MSSTIADELAALRRKSGLSVRQLGSIISSTGEKLSTPEAEAKSIRVAKAFERKAKDRAKNELTVTNRQLWDQTNTHRTTTLINRQTSAAGQHRNLDNGMSKGSAKNVRKPAQLALVAEGPALEEEEEGNLDIRVSTASEDMRKGAQLTLPLVAGASHIARKEEEEQQRNLDNHSDSGPAPASEGRTSATATTTSIFVTDDESADDESVNDELVNDESVNYESVNDESVNDESVNDESVNEKSVNDKSGDDESAKGESVNDESGSDESVNNESVNYESVNDESGSDKSVNDKSGDAESADGESGNDESSNGESGDDESGDGGSAEDVRKGAQLPLVAGGLGVVNRKEEEEERGMYVYPNQLRLQLILPIPTTYASVPRTEDTNLPLALVVAQPVVEAPPGASSVSTDDVDDVDTDDDGGEGERSDADSNFSGVDRGGSSLALVEPSPPPSSTNSENENDALPLGESFESADTDDPGNRLGQARQSPPSPPSPPLPPTTQKEEESYTARPNSCCCLDQLGFIVSSLLGKKQRGPFQVA